MITVPLAFREMPRWWHDAAGREWLDRLPSLVAEQCRRWDLQVDGGPLHGSNALVVPVRRGAEAAVLRLAPPGDDVSREAEALRWWDGRGTVRLLEADVPARAMLLERLSARSLQSVPLGEAVPIIADLAARMAVPAPPGATSTARIAAAHLEEFPRDWERQGRPVPRRPRGAGPCLDRAPLPVLPAVGPRAGAHPGPAEVPPPARPVRLRDSLLRPPRGARRRSRRGRTTRPWVGAAAR